MQRLVLILLLLPSAALAVDGISVTGHWSGENKNLYGGYGDVEPEPVEPLSDSGETLMSIMESY